MIHPDSSDSRSLDSRGLRFALIALVVFLGLAVVSIPYRRERTRISFERQQTGRRQEALNRIKGGATRVAILDTRLLPMLARDEACVANLRELNFSMVEVTSNHARFVSQLKNVDTLSFYDTRGVELVLEHARDLPISMMRLGSDRLSPESLRGLADFLDLEKVDFNYVVFPSEMAILEQLPSRISVHVPYPAEDEPGFDDRRKLMVGTD